jgi:hypothetical protein
MSRLAVDFLPVAIGQVSRVAAERHRGMPDLIWDVDVGDVDGGGNARALGVAERDGSTVRRLRFGVSDQIKALLCRPP